MKRFWILLDHLKVNLLLMNGSEVDLEPYMSRIHSWGKCVSFKLDSYKDALVKVKIRSPKKVTVYIHNEETFSISKELSTRRYFSVFQTIEVTVAKTIDLNQRTKPCYDPKDYDGKNYGKHEFEQLEKKIMEKFKCTTPFIPKEVREGDPICTDQKVGKLVHTFLESSASFLSTNIWSEHFHSLPPCVYHTHTFIETINNSK